MGVLDGKVAVITGQDLAIDGGILAGRPPAASAADFTAIAQALLPHASPP